MSTQPQPQPEPQPEPQSPTGTPRRALVSGASIAGLATAYWLARTGWQVSVVERAEEFRDGGQNVDVRGVAREVVQRMGLLDAVREATTTEEGTAFVDERGRRVGSFPVEGADGLTAELEVLRGDLARVVLDALPEGVELRWGTTIEAVDQGEGDDAVVVRLADGTEERWDLLVVAEGVRSATRELVLGDEVDLRPLGINMAYGTIERAADDDRWWRWLSATRSRQVTLRPDNVGTTRATLAHLSDVDLAAMGLDEARRELRRVFTGAGWVTERVLDGFDTSDDVYVDRLTQVRMPRWSVGRVAVTGDAAWCVTPLGGGGSSLALVGAYVLAAELSRPGASLREGLQRWEEWMRPVVDDVQDLPPGLTRIAYPASRAGVTVLRTAIRVGAAAAPLRKVFGRLGHVARSERELPELVQAPAAG